MENIKIKISNLVETYKMLQPDEYQQVVQLVKEKRGKLADEYAIVKSDYVERQLGEFPATLFDMFVHNLEPNEMEWFREKEGHRWFYNKYKEFRITKKI